MVEAENPQKIANHHHGGGDVARNSKRLKKEEETPKITNHGNDADEGIVDRLSDLPDSVLQHILSFLDAKSVFRTSFLSRRWGSVWKGVHVLNFNMPADFKSFSSFEQHVSKFLSPLLRSHDDDDHRSVAVVSSITFTGCGVVVGFHSFLSFEASHHFHQSLRTPKVRSFSLGLVDEGGGKTFFPGFNLLTNLELQQCDMFSPEPPWASPVESIDFPYLKYLKLVNCNARSWFSTSPRLLKVSGPELLDLQIENRIYNGQKVEVFAPKLKSFSFWGCVEELIQLDLPSLNHANIRIRTKQPQEIEATNRACLKLLPQLHNVESLNLRFDKEIWIQRRWEQHEFPLIGDMELFAKQPEVSPFTRLKTLRVWYPYKPPAVPDQVIRYFFEGSPRDTIKSFEFEEKVE